MSVYLFQPTSPLPYEILVTGDWVISSVSFGPPALPILGLFKGSYSHCLFPSPFPPFLVSSYISKSLLCTLYIARSMFSSIQHVYEERRHKRLNIRLEWSCKTLLQISTQAVHAMWSVIFIVDLVYHTVTQCCLSLLAHTHEDGFIL